MIQLVKIALKIGFMRDYDEVLNLLNEVKERWYLICQEPERKLFYT